MNPEKIIKKAMMTNTAITFIYEAKTGELTQRTVEVKKILAGRFVGYCYLRKGERIFKMDNVLSIQLKKRAETGS
ncbi:hypothetical protein [Bacillus sp. FJAT-44742]|uniref:hypothetical protein n=1 Tax=Bacillus sp. FJAT-44742 TaxID=2014005 RepID=UPI000C241F46|nr:hypothetical protein [Bacillus sp. FJAT-44742]